MSLKPVNEGKTIIDHPKTYSAAYRAYLELAPGMVVACFRAVSRGWGVGGGVTMPLPYPVACNWRNEYNAIGQMSLTKGPKT